MINLLLFLILLVLFGFSIETLIGTKNIGEKIGNSILLGSLFMTVAMLTDFQVNKLFDINRIIYILISLTAFISIFKWKDYIQTYKAIKKIKLKQAFKFSENQFFLILLIAFFILSTLLFNYFWPISDWDAIALYDFRSHVLKSGSWDIGIKLGYFFHYPPFTSLLHGVAYLLNFERAKVMYSFIYMGFLTSFYFLLRKRLTKLRSLVGIFLLTIAPLSSGHVLVAYTNLPYTIYFTLGVIYTWEWLSKRKDTDLLHAFIFIASSLWIRQSEPFWIIPVGLILITQVFSKKKASWKIILSGLFIFIGLYNYWPKYVETLNLQTSEGTALNDGVVAEKIKVTISTVLQNIFLVINHLFKYFLKPLITLIIPMSVIVFFDKTLQKEKYFLIQMLTIFLFISFVVGGTFIFSFTYATWSQIGGSLTRMVMFFEPLLIYIMMFSSLWFFDNKKN